jgi:hypothetical protein
MRTAITPDEKQSQRSSRFGGVAVTNASGETILPSSGKISPSSCNLTARFSSFSVQIQPFGNS